MSSARRKLAGTLGLAVAATGLSFVASPAAQAAPVTIRLLNINDFHGRIDANTTKLATTVERLRAQAGEANTLFLSAGDNIGASLFASSYQKDRPTIDVLNALDLATSSVGNHEFDGGFADLTGRVAETAEWDYLGANVYEADTEEPALEEYALYEVGGVTVGVIGAVTAETPSLVSPSGVAGLEFGDPVEAVNRVADELSDGDEGNGEADVIVAEFHEGASAGTPDDSTLEDEVAAGGVFADIVTSTSPEVDVIFTGHTHKQYAWDAPVPGTEGETRPVLQTGSYGEYVGLVDLTVDGATGEVTNYTQSNVARVLEADNCLQRVAEVKAIVDAALATAAEVGNQPIATITADITTAFNGTTRDNRAAESTLGGLVANALRDGLADIAQPDLGITNPGGLRAELLYAGNTVGNPANTDGVVTFAEANAVLPFNNTVALVELTGAQLKTVLEQQWQRDENGAIPSRPYLQLGLSDNVVVTADASRDEGDRITSVTIDGSPLDPAATYAVSTLSFLADGGDNFWAFAEGTMVDTGLLDAELWRTYLAESSPLEPDFARQQVFETGMPTRVNPGASYDFTLGPDLAAPTQPNIGETLDLTSLGSPENFEVRIIGVPAEGGPIDLGAVPVVNGVAEVNLNVPDELTDGVVRLVAVPSGTTVTLPVGAAAAPAARTATRRTLRSAAPAAVPPSVQPVAPAAVALEPSCTPTPTPTPDVTTPQPATAIKVVAPPAAGKRGKVTLTMSANGRPLTGTVLVQVRNKVIEVVLTNGTGTFKLGKKIVRQERQTKKGKVKATLVFTGSTEVLPFQTTTKFTVKKKRK